MKKHKFHTPKQASASNSAAEVFVLPPELLAKLGINLNNGQQSEVATKLVKDTIQSVDHSIPDRLPEDAPSIIQTANLMKESVLLSPTFFQTAAIAVPDEEPIVIDESVDNTKTAISSECGTLSHQCNRNCVTVTKINNVGEQCIPQLPNDKIVVKPNLGIPIEEVINVEDYESVKEYQVENHDGDLILTDVPYQNTENDKISNDKSDATITVEEHPDEAYLSDCSNSYSGCSPESVNSDVNKQNASNKNEKEEMSEMIATKPLQVKNIEDMDVICSTSDAIFTPVVMNSIVTLHEGDGDSAVTDKQPAVIATIQSIIDDPDIHARSSKVEQNKPSNHIILMKTDKPKDIKAASVINEFPNKSKQSNDTSIVDFVKPLPENVELIFIADKISKEPLQENKEFVLIAEENFQGVKIDKKAIEQVEHNPYNNTATDIRTKDKEKSKSVTKSLINTQDRVKEIAAYLSQIANERKNMNSIRNIEKVAKGDPITSRLCIQGVEKPGGRPVKKEKKEKTYQRAIIRRKYPNVIKMSDAVMTTDSFQITGNNHDTPIDGAKVRALTHQNEFCICYDFGNLAYYDCEMLYEHIHFWSHKNIEYDSETLYSLYQEDHTMFKQSVDFVEDAHQNEHDGNTIIEDKLCWNEINTLKKNEEKCELPISKSRLSAKAGSSSEQKNKPIPEKSPVVNDDVKKIKCGVCNQVVSEKEWQLHKEKEHNSVACEADLKLKINSGTAPKPSKSAKSTQKLTRKSINSDCHSYNTKITTKSNNDDKNDSGSSRSVSVSEVTPKLHKKTVDLAVDKDISSKPTKKNPKFENVVSSAQAPSTSKNQANYIELKRMQPSRSTRKSSLNTVSNTANLLTAVNETDKSKREQTGSSDISTNKHDTKTETAKHNRRLSKSKNDFVESKGKLTENNKVTRSAKTRDTIIPTQKLLDKGNTLRVSKAMDIRTYMKSARKSSDTTTKTASEATKSSSFTHQETNTVTTTSAKRSSNTEMLSPPAKKDKTTESSIIIEIVDDDVSNKHLKERKTVNSKHIKVKKQSKSAESCVLPVVPSKVDNIDCTEQSKTVEITILNYELPDESMDVTIEESTIPDDSVASAMESSTLSSDTAKNDSQSTEYYMVLDPIKKSNDLKKCGVCKKSVEESQWKEHITKEHDYIAWCDGKPLVDLEDELELRKHLQGIANQNEGLTCTKCGLVRKFAKTFIRHIRSCNGDKQDCDTSQEQEDHVSSVAAPYTCGVCNKTVEQAAWIEHIQRGHKYLAWTSEEQPLNLNNAEEVKKHLKYICKQRGELICNGCGLKCKLVKKYLRHIRKCDYDAKDHNEYVPLLNTPRKSRDKPLAPPYTCGVCAETVEQAAWIEHIQRAHKYLAWTSEEQPLDLNNEEEVKAHLKYISKQHGGLICNICGVRLSYVKKYLDHIRACESGSVTKISSRNEHRMVKLVLPPIVTCGVCKLDVEGKDWIKHIQIAHQYVAWIGGEEPLDPNDPDQMKGHLDMIVHAAGELVCMKCGEARKFTRAYLQHIAACAKTDFHIEINALLPQDKTKYICGVCHESGEISQWRSHAMSMHYNVAWKVGDVPINLKNPYAVEKYMKQYKKKHSLVCHHCKASRTSCYGFYAHILTCGKTEEEIESFHDVCELCNNKYLCIYRNQHMAAHRDSDQRRAKREMLAQKAEEDALNPPMPAEILTTGKRRAAEKAKKGIQKLSSNRVDGMPVCGCGEMFKDAEEFSQHKCAQKKQTNEDDDSDVSVKIENESEESADEIVDSGVSDEEDEKSDKKKKRVRVGEGSTKAKRMPYRVSNYISYLSAAYKDFVRIHHTTQRLYNEWRDSEYQVVPEEEMAKYLPQVKESCKVRFGNQSSDEWTTYMRFEAKKIKGHSLFTGGAIQCIAWAPINPNNETLSSYLAVSTHRGPDVSRYSAAERPHYPASLQIWDFGQFDMLPKCALCLAHEYGVVWAMDWCPSGARDASPITVLNEFSEVSTVSLRLGLLAIACSNGSAYILAVPCPPSQQNQHEPVMYKLKPVAELRLTMTMERHIYQATSIKWSQQKGHRTIIVGYSDGTTALYELNSESPFLSAIEKGVTIYYPYQDRRSECSSITGVGVCATTNETYSIGGQYSSSMTGATLCGGTAVRPSARVHLAVSSAVPSAHWPAVTLAGDIPFMRAVSEMEWWGGGRRVGIGRAWAACMRCGRTASATQPALRSHRHHPAYPDIKKLIVALLLMVPLGQKRKRKVNDDLSVVVEPLTYEDAAAKYGLQLTFVTKSSKSEQLRAQQVCNDNESRPERFPLSDIVALAFCPSGRFHDRIALATHTGIIFVVNL